MTALCVTCSGLILKVSCFLYMFISLSLCLLLFIYFDVCGHYAFIKKQLAISYFASHTLDGDLFQIFSDWVKRFP